MKRISIYFFWDKNGEVADYVLQQLRAMRDFVSESCVVVNGCIPQTSEQALQQVADTVLIRENKGMDAAAYQYAIRHYGYEQLSKYDELILWNYTCYGPFGSFARIFSEMAQKDCGFWGLGRWPTYAPYREYHHIPSYFCGYRKSLLEKEIFRDYWEELGDTSSYDLSVKNHEQLQTPYYEERGIKTATLFENTDKYKDFWHTNMMPLMCADKLFIEDAFPFVKRRIFYPLSSGYSNYSSVAVAILKHIQKTISEVEYSLILQDLRRSIDIEAYHISKWQLFLLKLHIGLSFSSEKRTKRRNKYQWALHSCELYNLLTTP